MFSASSGCHTFVKAKQKHAQLRAIGDHEGLKTDKKPIITPSTPLTDDIRGFSNYIELIVFQYSFSHGGTQSQSQTTVEDSTYDYVKQNKFKVAAVQQDKCNCKDCTDQELKQNLQNQPIGIQLRMIYFVFTQTEDNVRIDAIVTHDILVVW